MIAFHAEVSAWYGCFHELLWFPYFSPWFLWSFDG